MKEISVIIPHYNEERRIRENWEKYLSLYSYLENKFKNFEIILEEDGSTDSTKELLRELSEQGENFVFLSFPEKQGKGGGLIKGVMHSKGKYIILCDADFPVPFETIGRMIEELRKGWDIVIPSRRHPESKTEIPRIRKFFSFSFNILFRLLFGIKVSDTQIGVKGFRAEILKRCLPRIAKGFAMDIEIIVRGVSLGAKIKEIPTEYVHGKESKLSIIRDVIPMFKEVIRVWRAWRDGELSKEDKLKNSGEDENEEKF